VGQQKIEQADRRAAVLAAFDSMSDEAQVDVLCMLQSIARSSPRRASIGLRLVASGSGGDGLRKSAGGGQ
jgi:hypothetical protein